MEFLSRTVGDWHDCEPALMPGDMGRLHRLSYLILYPVRAYFDVVNSVNSRPWLDTSAGAMLCFAATINREMILPPCDDLDGIDRLDALQCAARIDPWKITFDILEHSRRWDQFFGPIEDGRAARLDLPVRSTFDYGAFFGESFPDPLR